MFTDFFNNIGLSPLNFFILLLVAYLVIRFAVKAGVYSAIRKNRRRIDRILYELLEEDEKISDLDDYDDFDDSDNIEFVETQYHIYDDKNRKRIPKNSYNQNTKRIVRKKVETNRWNKKD